MYIVSRASRLSINLSVTCCHISGYHRYITVDPIVTHVLPLLLAMYTVLSSESYIMNGCFCVRLISESCLDYYNCENWD